MNSAAVVPRYADRNLDLSAADRVLRRSPLLDAGSFECPPGHEAFAGGRVLSCFYLAFPRTVVELQTDAFGPFVATPALMTMYVPGDAPRRRPISGRGDCCDYLTLDATFLRDLLDEIAPRAAEALAAGRFRFERPVAAADVDAMLAVRMLYRRLRTDPPLSTLEFEERAEGVVRRALGMALHIATSTPSRAGARTARQRRCVERVKEHLGAEPATGCSLSELARMAHTTPTHLAVVFKRHTGMTVHAYVTRLRLSRALDLIDAGHASLSEIAVACGFSHHSHFSLVFRRCFGMVPTAYVRCGRSARNRARTLARARLGALTPSPAGT